MVDALHNLGILDTGAQPDIGQHLTDQSADHRCHALRALGENLIVMAGRLAHDVPYRLDKGVADLFMEQVAH